jgi:hypothetical protein
MRKYIAMYMVPQRVIIDATDTEDAVRIARDSAIAGDKLDGFSPKLMTVEVHPDVEQLYIPPDAPMPPMAA